MNRLDALRAKLANAINDPSPFDNAIAFALLPFQSKCILDLEEALGEQLVRPDLVVEAKR